MLSPCCDAWLIASWQSRLCTIIWLSGRWNPITSSPGIGWQTGHLTYSGLGRLSRYWCMFFIALYDLAQVLQLFCGHTLGSVPISTQSPRFSLVRTDARCPLILAYLACMPTLVCMWNAKSIAVEFLGSSIALPSGVYTCMSSL